MFSNKRVRGNLSLVNSMTIKMSSIAESMNYELEKFGVVYDVEDPTTWAYYKNISGTKHAANTAVYFTAVETNTEVELTAANLIIYQRSKTELLQYDTYFSDLVKKYAGQELYIRGVIAPVDTATAIAAPDGRILIANKDFLDYNETSVLQKLSTASERFVDRWDVPQYTLIENLYAPAVYGALINFLIVKLHLIRLENITTMEISDSYIIDTLNSYMGVGKFAASLNRSSKLWLAKTIKYIAYNIGKDLTLDLIDINLLKPNGVDVYEVDVVQSSPIDSGSTDPTVDNTIYTDNVLYTVLKNGSATINELKLFSELNSQSFVDPSVVKDYAQGSSKYNTTTQRLIDSDIDERSKFYVLQKNEDVNFMVHSHYKVITDAIALMFNSMSGYLATGTSKLVTTSGFQYDVPNSTLFEYFLYGIGIHSGYNDVDIVDGRVTGDTVQWNPNSLIRHDFIIADALANLHNRIPEYNTVLTAMKAVLVDPASVGVVEYITSQLKVQAILGSCVSRIDGPVQEAELLSIIKCISMPSIPVIIAKPYGDLVNPTVMRNIYPVFAIENVMDVLTALSGSNIDKNAKSIELLTALKNIVSALTSYTVFPIANMAFSDEFINTGKIGALEGELIVYIKSAEIRCGGVVTTVASAVGNDEILTVDVLQQSLLYSTSNNNRIMSVFVDGGNRNTVMIERPVLISG